MGSERVDPAAIGAVKREYIERANTHAVAHAAVQRVSTSLSRWRLATFLPALALLAWGMGGGGGVVAFAASGALLLVFGILVVWHARVDDRASRFEALRVVNERAVARIDRHWDALPAADPPAGVSLEGHPYAQDLDLFGRASLFQWLGAPATPHGAATLARWLLSPADPSDVVLRQEGVDDLARRVEWREALAAYGTSSDSHQAPRVEAFLGWLESDAAPMRHFRMVRIAVYTILVLLWFSIGLHAAGVTPALWPIPLVAGMVLSFVTALAVQRAFDAAGSSELGLRRYAPLFAHLTSVRFETAWLRALQERLRSDVEAAPQAMNRLNRILGFSELRRGAALLHFPIQALTLWDFHVLFALLRWRRGVRGHVRDWLEAAGDIDAVACFAQVRHDYPGWSVARFSDERTFRARQLGHPLIADNRRVGNDVAVGPPGTVLVVTGSNMSGKSTLLRAIGLNVVLAQAGAPACAADLQMPALDLQTSIRIQDSLERGMSYFMAALARLKGVVDAADREASDRVLLYLLDEILQGTNSAERAIAVQAVARHLLDAGAIGAITTHDLSVVEEEPLRSAAVLVHFTETVGEDGRMEFDYTLRPGLATSRNALRLMRLIGIR